MAELNQSLTFVRGDTAFSPLWYFTNEQVPPGTTMEEFLEGLRNGTYTLVDLSQFTIRGHVRRQHNSSIVIDLTSYFATTDNILRFVIPPNITSVLANERHSMGYDIEFTRTETSNVKTMIAGGFTITTDYTHNDPNPVQVGQL